MYTAHIPLKLQIFYRQISKCVARIENDKTTINK